MEDDTKIESDYKINKVKDLIYKFFYNIWPAINRALNSIYYYSFKVIKGFVRIAMEQIRRG